jgi:4'-phosphopantetheinyl transferase EntD
MIAEILPLAVVAVESFGRLPLGLGLFAAEESAIATADSGRRAEFAAGRECAHAALAQLGAPAGPILPGRAGEPRWPAGVVGSITHCAGYRACAVARTEDVAAIGIDAEPARALPPGLAQAVAVGAERRWLTESRPAEPDVPRDLVLFCAKEAVYKAWFQLTGRSLGFADVLTSFVPAGYFAARVAGARHPSGAGQAAALVTGRWLVRDGLAVTVATVRRRGRLRP